MELHHLKYFTALAECASVSRAALQLSVTPSGLRRSIADLEAELGVRLLHRLNGGIALTEAGDVFYAHARSILKQVVDVGLAVKLQPHFASGTVVAALPQSVAPVLGLPLLEAVSERLPNVRLHLTDELDGNILEQLRRGRVDLAVFTSNIPLPEFRFEPFLEEDFHVLRSPAMAWRGGEGAVLPRHLASHPIVWPAAPHGQCTREIVEGQFKLRASSQLRVSMEVSSLQLLKYAVESAAVLTVMPPAAAAREIAEGRLCSHAIQVEGLTRTLGICLPTSLPPSDATRAVCATVISVAQALCRAGAWPGSRLARRLQSDDGPDIVPESEVLFWTPRSSVADTA